MPQTLAQKLKCKGRLQDVRLSRIGVVALAPETAVDLVDDFCSFPDAPDPEIADADPADIERFLGVSNQKYDGENTSAAEELKLTHASYLARKQEEARQARQFRRLRQFGSRARGSWVVGCTQEFPDNHGVYFFVDRESYPDLLKRRATTTELDGLIQSRCWEVIDGRLFRVNGNANLTAEQVADKWEGKTLIDIKVEFFIATFAYFGLACVEVNDGREGSKHHIHMRSRFLRGYSGVAWYMANNCSTHVNCVCDKDQAFGLHRFLKLMAAHEPGHCVNLDHDFNRQHGPPNKQTGSGHHGKMSYSWESNMDYDGFRSGSEINSPASRYPKDPSYDELVRRFGGVPIWKPGDEPTPEPDPPPSGQESWIFVATEPLTANVPVPMTIGDRPQPNAIFTPRRHYQPGDVVTGHTDERN